MISGAYTALVTPFGADGEIDYPGVARLLAWHESEGMTGVVVAGTNGEGQSLSAVEKRDLIAFACKHAGNPQVLLGAGTCSLPEARWLCKQAGNAGAVAALVLPPFYFKAEERGIEKWFTELIAGSDLPIVVYNFPQTTGITLSPALIGRLFELERAVGIKDSSGNRELMEAYLEQARVAGRAMLVGDERLLLGCLAGGGSGTISGIANSFPRLISRQVSERSEALQALIDEAAANVKKHPTPAVHKSILDRRGLPGGPVRPPLVDLAEDARAEVYGFVDRFGF